MNFRCVLGVATILLASFAPVGGVNAQTIRSGPVVEIDGAADGVIAFGGKVDVGGEVGSRGLSPVSGVVAFGGSVSVDASIDGGVTISGGDVTFSGSADSARIAGGSVVVAGEVRGDAAVAGGAVDLTELSVVTGDLDAAGATVTLRGQVKGDAAVTAEKIVIADGALIEGDLKYESSEPAEIADGAVIRGATEYTELSDRELERRRDRGPLSAAGARQRAYGAMFWFVALGASGALIGVLFPGWIGRAAEMGRDTPVGSLLIGIGVLIATPVVALLSMLIVLGIPFGILLLAGYAGIVFVSFIGAGYGLGHLLLDRAEGRDANLGLFLAGLAIILIAGAAPYVGWIISFLAASYGTGVLARSLIASLRARARLDAG